MTLTETDGDDRIVRESGIDARIALIVQPVLRGAGFRLVRLRLSGQHGLTLQVMAEREDGTMTVEDCEEVSRAISPALDVDREGVSSGSVLAGHRPPACAQVGFHHLGRPSDQDGDLGHDHRPQALQGQDRRSRR